MTWTSCWISSMSKNYLEKKKHRVLIKNHSFPRELSIGIQARNMCPSDHSSRGIRMQYECSNNFMESSKSYRFTLAIGGMSVLSTWNWSFIYCIYSITHLMKICNFTIWIDELLVDEAIAASWVNFTFTSRTMNRINQLWLTHRLHTACHYINVWWTDCLIVECPTHILYVDASIQCLYQRPIELTFSSHVRIAWTEIQY